jgi:hypothetical protein
MRRFITKRDIDAVADAGRDTLEIDDLVTVTDVAREHARSRSVRFVRVAGPADGNGSGHVDDESFGPTKAAVREQIRRAVVDRVGQEPPDLQRVIDRVLRSQE